MKTEPDASTQPKAAPNSSPETIVGFAILGCLVAGTVGIIKALSMDNGFGVFLCLIGSVVAFTSVYYIYCGKS